MQRRERPSPSPLEIGLADWLRRRLKVFRVEKQIFAAGHEIVRKVVPCDRLILVLSGSLNYQLEQDRYTVGEGSELYIPAWVQRGWTAAAGSACELLWVEFGPSAALPFRLPPFQLANPDLPLEKAAMGRLLKLWKEADTAPFRSLLMEAELKGCLARFLSQCADAPLPAVSAAPESPAERVIADLVRDLKEHFASPGALARILAEIPISANYARRLFREQTGTTISGYLTQLRMHEARYQLHESSLPVKEVARRVGFDDPLRFSKVYHQFWGHAPMAERGSGKKG